MKSLQIILAAVLVSVTSAFAINVGDTAPTFSLTKYTGGTFNLTQQKGKVTVIFFLGCT